MEVIQFENKEFRTSFPLLYPNLGRAPTFTSSSTRCRLLRPLLCAAGDVLGDLTDRTSTNIVQNGEISQYDVTDVAISRTPSPEIRGTGKFDGDGGASPPAPASPTPEEMDAARERRASSITQGGELVAILKNGSWFGHEELLAAYDDPSGGDTPELIPWRHAYKARKMCDLMYMVRGDGLPAPPLYLRSPRSPTHPLCRSPTTSSSCSTMATTTSSARSSSRTPPRSAPPPPPPPPPRRPIRLPRPARRPRPTIRTPPGRRRRRWRARRATAAMDFQRAGGDAGNGGRAEL